jgi:hypothetical protein
MARGWESKSVEEQMQMANALGNSGTDLAGRPVSDEVRRAAEQRRASRERQKQALNLQRENILSQRTSNPVRRAALEAALAQVEGQIQAME